MLKLAFPLIFGLFWTGIVGAFDVMIGLNAYRAIRAQSFPTTTGAITHSKVSNSQDSDGGSTYGVDIRYTYQVDGQELEGANYRYMAGSSSDSDWAHEAVREHKVGAPVTVYYDPKRPTDSVLKPGVDSSDLFLALFLTPFNLVMAAIWWFAGTTAWHWWNGTQPRIVTAFREPAALRVRLPDTPPILTGFVTVGVASFISIFVVAFSAGFHPSMTFVLIVWTAVLGAGIGTGAWLWKKQRDGAFDLLIADRNVELPAMFGRKTRETVERRALTGVSIETLTHEGKRGPTYTYAIKLQRKGASEAKIAEWSDEKSANDLAAWLRTELGLKQPPK